MQTWALPVLPARYGADSRAGQIADCLAGAIDAIGEAHFAASALACVNTAVAVDFWSVYSVGQDQEPRMFLSGSLAQRDVSLDCFRRYQRGLYRRDKTLAGARNLALTGQPAMTLWNEAQIPSPHREQIYRRHDIHERLSLVASGDLHNALALNLYRFKHSGGFRAGEVDAVQLLARTLLSCVNKHLQVLGRRQEAGASALTHAKDFLRHRNAQLTARELDVCERLLRGWTYEGIAQDLALSVASVKTYRARAFDRLGIHFRNELFALAISAQDIA